MFCLFDAAPQYDTGRRRTVLQQQPCTHFAAQRRNASIEALRGAALCGYVCSHGHTNIRRLAPYIQPLHTTPLHSTPLHSPPRPLPFTRSFSLTPLLRVSASYRSSDSLSHRLTALSPLCRRSFLICSTASRLHSRAALSPLPLSSLSSLPRPLPSLPFSGRPPCLS